MPSILVKGTDPRYLKDKVPLIHLASTQCLQTAPGTHAQLTATWLGWRTHSYMGSNSYSPKSWIWPKLAAIFSPSLLLEVTSLQYSPEFKKIAFDRFTSVVVG